MVLQVGVVGVMVAPGMSPLDEVRDKLTRVWRENANNAASVTPAEQLVVAAAKELLDQGRREGLIKIAKEWTLPSQDKDHIEMGTALAWCLPLRELAPDLNQSRDALSVQGVPSTDRRMVHLDFALKQLREPQCPP